MAAVVDLLFAASAGRLDAPNLLTPTGAETDLVVTFTASETNGADTPVLVNFIPPDGGEAVVFYQGTIPMGGTLVLPSIAVPSGAVLALGATGGGYDVVGTGWRHIPS